MQRISSWSSYLRSKREASERLTLDQEIFLIAQRETKYRDKAIEEILGNYSSVIHSIIKKYKWSNIPYDDLYYYGLAGLVVAYDNFDVSKGNRFSTYCYHYVLGRVRRAIEQYNNLIRKPAHINQTLNKLSDVDIENLSDEELEEYITDRISLNNIKSAIGAKNQKVISFYDLNFDIVQELSFEKLELENFVDSIINSLNDRESKCLILRYGLYNNPIHTLKQLDIILGCDTECLLRNIFNKIRDSASPEV